MTEEKLKALRQADNNLRDALRMDEAKLPQMSADLNERLMQRVATGQKKPRRTVWPWIAAACVAGVMMMIWVTPPNDTTSTVASQTPSPTPFPLTRLPVAFPLNGKGEISSEVSKVEEPVVAKVDKKEVPQRTTRAKKARDTQKVLNPQTTDVSNDLATVQGEKVFTPLPSGEGQGGGSAIATVTLTERDIPVTRPENLKHTPEELALLKKQANEAYLKWVELELEISKYNIEQASSK